MGCGHMGWLPYQLSVQVFRLSWPWRERAIPVGSKAWAGLHTKTDDVVRFVQDQVFYRALLTDSATSCLTDKENGPGGMPLSYGGGRSAAVLPPTSLSVPVAARGCHECKGPVSLPQGYLHWFTLLWSPQWLQALTGSSSAVFLCSLPTVREGHPLL